MQTDTKRPTNQSGTQRYRRPSITDRAGIPKAESPRYAIEILEALNRVLGSR